jgi:hypothetical protein
VDEEREVKGGSEGDIRSLYYWSHTAFLILIIAGAVWIALAAYRFVLGARWYGRDWSSGSTSAMTQILVGVVFVAAALVCFFLARRTNNEIVTVFSARRYQVPREKLLVYSLLALPFGFIVPGLLLAFVNVKLSYPEFLPSHAEAYPEAMPGYTMVPTSDLTREMPLEGPEDDLIPEDAPKDLPPLGFESMEVSEEEAQPAAEFFSDLPAFPSSALPAVPPQEEAAPAPPAVAPPMEAVIEEVPEDEVPMDEIPEVVAEITPAPPPVAYEEVPQEGVVEAVVEEVPEEGEAEGDFELMLEEDVEGEDEEAPKTIEEAHDQLLGKLLGK